MDQYCARICWNSHGWVFPSGEAKKLENDSYVTKAGFGHEEWLFNFAWLVNGYHYAFLQPVSDSYDNIKGKTIDILLFSINANGDRVYVGELHNCEVITQEQSQTVLEHYQNAGWHKSMKEQVRRVGGDADRLSNAPDQFNIRFAPKDAELYSPLRLAGAEDFVRRLNRYKLVKVAGHPAAVKQWRRRAGTRTAPTLHTITRSGQPGVTYDPVHAALQGELQKLLEIRFGRQNVILEEDYVDITVTTATTRTLIELKSDPDARLAIRKAMGQILEYAYFRPTNGNRMPRLVIVAPGQMTPDVANYLAALRKKFGLVLTYCSYSLGQPLPTALT